jgi:hypothetical protein
MSKAFIDGFDACLDMVFTTLDKHEEKALFSVYKFINELKDELEYEAELYRKDG